MYRCIYGWVYLDVSMYSTCMMSVYRTLFPGRKVLFHVAELGELSYVHSCGVLSRFLLYSPSRSASAISAASTTDALYHCRSSLSRAFHSHKEPDLAPTTAPGQNGGSPLSGPSPLPRRRSCTASDTPSSGTIHYQGAESKIKGTDPLTVRALMSACGVEAVLLQP